MAFSPITAVRPRSPLVGPPPTATATPVASLPPGIIVARPSGDARGVPLQPIVLRLAATVRPAPAPPVAPRNLSQEVWPQPVVLGMPPAALTPNFAKPALAATVASRSSAMEAWPQPRVLAIPGAAVASSQPAAFGVVQSPHARPEDRWLQPQVLGVPRGRPARVPSPVLVAGSPSLERWPQPLLTAPPIATVAPPSTAIVARRNRSLRVGSRGVA